MPAKPYKVVVVGLGKRGGHHISAFQKDPRFEIAGVVDIDKSRVDKVGAELGGSVVAGTDAATVAKQVKPDVFCFCTLPNLRLPLIKVGVEAGAKLIAYEKPVALSMNEALEIRKLVKQAGVKTVVSHQHRYGVHYQKVHEIVQSGALGRVHTVYGTAVGWMTHVLSHLVDYMLWYNGNAEAEWVMAQAAGGQKFADNHPSPDYIAGTIHFKNGVRGWIECGAGAPDVPEVDYWWRKNRIGVQGTEGFAEVLTGGGWRAVTAKNGLQTGDGCMNYDLDTPPYVAAMADWLDDDTKVHPGNGESAHQGMEITMALLRSVVDRGQVKLPLGPGEPEIEAAKRTIPERAVLLSIEASRKEYPGAAS
jgi:predicted dehydrogenase